MITVFSPIVKRLARALAYSRLINRRNLEGWWYGEAMMHATELAAGLEYAVVVPQMPLEFFEKGVEPPPAEDEDGQPVEEEGPEDGDDLEDKDMEEVVLNQQLASDTPSNPSPPHIAEGQANILTAALDDDFDPFNDISFAETDSTPPSNLRIPDFGIVIMRSEELPKNHHLHRRLQGVDITASLVVVLIENKRHPSRSLKGGHLAKKVRRLLDLAQDDLMEQAVVLFSEHDDLDVVRCISMSGPYWRHAVITRNMAFQSREYTKLLRRPNPSVLGGKRRPEWSHMFIWGSPASDKQRDILREEIETKYHEM